MLYILRFARRGVDEDRKDPCVAVRGIDIAGEVPGQSEVSVPDIPLTGNEASHASAFGLLCMTVNSCTKAFALTAS